MNKELTRINLVIESSYNEAMANYYRLKNTAIYESYSEISDNFIFEAKNDSKFMNAVRAFCKGFWAFIDLIRKKCYKIKHKFQVWKRNRKKVKLVLHENADTAEKIKAYIQDNPLELYPIRDKDKKENIFEKEKLSKFKISEIYNIIEKYNSEYERVYDDTTPRLDKAEKKIASLQKRMDNMAPDEDSYSEMTEDMKFLTDEKKALTEQVDDTQVNMFAIHLWDRGFYNHFVPKVV